MRRRWRRRRGELVNEPTEWATGDDGDDCVFLGTSFHATADRSVALDAPFLVVSCGLRVDCPIECSECGAREWYVEIEFRPGAAGTARCAVCESTVPLYAHPA
jgi:hypothetical protein